MPGSGSLTRCGFVCRCMPTVSFNPGPREGTAPRHRAERLLSLAEEVLRERRRSEECTLRIEFRASFCGGSRWWENGFYDRWFLALARGRNDPVRESPEQAPAFNRMTLYALFRSSDGAKHANLVGGG